MYFLFPYRLVENVIYRATHSADVGVVDLLAVVNINNHAAIVGYDVDIAKGFVNLGGEGSGVFLSCLQVYFGIGGHLGVVGRNCRYDVVIDRLNAFAATGHIVGQNHKCNVVIASLSGSYRGLKA